MSPVQMQFARRLVAPLTRKAFNPLAQRPFIQATRHIAVSSPSLMAKYVGGNEHVKTWSDADPIDNHTCHCAVCKKVTGQPSTHVAFFKHDDLKVEGELTRQPFNAENPDGPLELCCCKKTGFPIMLDDKVGRIRVVVPNIMGFSADFPATFYHAFFDAAAGNAMPNDGKPVEAALRPDFVWPAGTPKFVGGNEHVKVSAFADPIDNHTCHCDVCKKVTGQPSTHVAFFKYDDLKVEGELTRQPFNAENPDGPLELCCCKKTGFPIMLDDKVGRIRVVVPNIMGFPADFPATTYHAFFDAKAGKPMPNDGKPIRDALRPDFVWPAGK